MILHYNTLKHLRCAEHCLLLKTDLYVSFLKGNLRPANRSNFSSTVTSTLSSQNIFLLKSRVINIIPLLSQGLQKRVASLNWYFPIDFCSIKQCTFPLILNVQKLKKTVARGIIVIKGKTSMTFFTDHKSDSKTLQFGINEFRRRKDCASALMKSCVLPGSYEGLEENGVQKTQ